MCMRVDGIPGNKSVAHEDLPVLIQYIFPRMPRTLTPSIPCPCFFLSSPPKFLGLHGYNLPGSEKAAKTCLLENKTWAPPWGQPRTPTGGTQIAVEPHSTMIAHVYQGLCELSCTSWEQPDKMPVTTENVVPQNTFVQVSIARDVENWTRPHLRLKSFFASRSTAKHLIVCS